MTYRQRNIVFPETVMNNARFWRNLSSRKYAFTSGQKMCFAILLVIVAPPLFAWDSSFTSFARTRMRWIC
jgi:hypothetical protein